MKAGRDWKECLMIELPYERLAMRGEPMPEGLDFADVQMFQALSSVYRRFYLNEISRDAAAIEKRALLDAYEDLKRYTKMFTEVAKLWPRAEQSAIAFRKDPTVANGVRLYNAIYQTNWKIDDENDGHKEHNS